MSCFEVLDGLLFFAVNFFHFLVIQRKMLDPGPYQRKMDPKHFL